MEITSLNEYLLDQTGHSPRYFRPPGGRYNRRVLTVLNELGLKMVLWDVNPGDYHQALQDQSHHYPYAVRTFQRSSSYMVSTILKRIQPGSILLFHNATGETLKTLSALIPELRHQGFEFVTLSTLLKEPS